MRFDTRGLRLSPTDLAGFLGCRHRTGLDLAVADGVLEKPDWSDPLGQALRDRGAEHERAFVEYLADSGLRVLSIDTTRGTDDRVAQTLSAMREGADIIVQAALTAESGASVAGRWLGYADVLRRVAVPSVLGPWAYEPCDTKLARETRGGTVLQLAVYADLLGAIQDVRPERFWVVTPGDEGRPFTEVSYRYDEFSAYVRMVRAQLASDLATGHERLLQDYYPEPVEHCDLCRWADRCEKRRRADDHMSYIAGIGRAHREELDAQGIRTMAAVAAMPLPISFKPARGSADTYERLCEQARVQVQQRKTGRPVFELLPIEEGQGLARLPEPSEGDLFLDLEGARFAREGGREYLFGLWGEVPGTRDPVYTADWALTDGEECAAFERVMDRISSTLERHPDAHIYHFGHYEPSAFKRLSGRHATRADSLDALLRGERFVDLHTIVRQAVRAGVESYSLKQLEAFHGFSRQQPLREAGYHLQAVELALEGAAPGAVTPESQEVVRRYNEDDCRSTESLRAWLESVRSQVIARGTVLSRPGTPGEEPSDAVGELERRQREARERLLAGLDPEASQPGHPQHPRWLLAYLLDWHRREDKSAWWEFFRLRDLPEADLFDEPQGCAGLEFQARVEVRKSDKTAKPTGTVVDRYRYPAQEMEIRPDTALRRPGGIAFGKQVAHDRASRTIDIQKGRAIADEHPTAVLACEVINTQVLQEAMLELSQDVDAANCGMDLLFRRPPRLSAGKFSSSRTGDIVQQAVTIGLELDRSTLAIQGPPGAGKTFAGAQMIRALVQAGKKVGVTAVSHKVIRNLLDAVVATPMKGGEAIRVGHRRNTAEADGAVVSEVVDIDDNGEALDALASADIDVLGGTAWLWSRPEAQAAVDVLFIDEAGQMSLANALAVSRATNSLVLLGDPQQLEQPQKGSHPDGVGVSALDHILGDATTMPPELGLFLPTTWRLHPNICAFTSEVFYEGRLVSRPSLEQQALVGTRGFDGAGLWWWPVVHSGNQTSSMEEVEAVEWVVGRLLGNGAQWRDQDGELRSLQPTDIRVVAPYNAQVTRLSERFEGRGVPVGTVDKFQGQEAPVVIYSMATSRPEDAPRGMEFLYSLNRLNVATSRARCAAILVASEALLEPACRTPRQMKLASALCRYAELGQRVAYSPSR